MPSFDQILQHAVTPIVLISGVGLILLSLNSRFSSALAKTRSIIDDLSEATEEKRRHNLQNQVQILLKRCLILQISIALVVISTVFSSFIVFISILSPIIGINSEAVLTVLLFLSCCCVMIANLLLFWDVAISLRALKLEVDYSLSMLKKNKN